MIRNRIWVIALSLCATACTPSGSPDDVAIFEATVQSEACNVGQWGGYNVVSDRPASLQYPGIEDEWAKWLTDPRALSVSLARAEQRRKWPLLTPCGNAVRVVDADFVEGLFERHKNMVPRPWNSFYAAFPKAGGLFKISAPILDAEGNTALVYVERTCDVLCGRGWLVELRKENGRWQVVLRDTKWIS